MLYCLYLAVWALCSPTLDIYRAVCDQKKKTTIQQSIDNKQLFLVYSTYLQVVQTDCRVESGIRACLHANLEVSFAQSSVQSLSLLFQQLQQAANSEFPIPVNVKAHFLREEKQNKTKNIQYWINLCVLPRQGTTYSHCLTAPEYESVYSAKTCRTEQALWDADNKVSGLELSEWQEVQ